MSKDRLKYIIKQTEIVRDQAIILREELGRILIQLETMHERMEEESEREELIKQTRVG